MDQGFSLTEVLVSLLLMTTTSLALLKHQWQVSQLYNQVHLRASALSSLDNAAERLGSGDSAVTAESPLKLRYKRVVLTPKASGHLASHRQEIITLQVTWVGTSSENPLPACLSRQLVVDIGDD